MKRRQTASRAQLDRWREAESSSQLNLKKAAEETARLARRGNMVDPGKRRRDEVTRRDSRQCNITGLESI